MSEQRFIEVNGEYYLSNEAVLFCNNRAFLYGDALFETMVSFNGKIPFIKDHIFRLKKSMEVLKMRIPFQFKEEFFQDRIERLRRKNKYFKGVRIRLTVFRKEGGLYTPDTNDVSYILDVAQLPLDKFSLNSEGFQIDVFKEHLKPINSLSALKSTNDLLYIMAGIYKKDNNLDECVLLNQHKYICESLSSNIFLVKNNKLYTPSVESGCLPGVMRKNIIEILKKNEIFLEETTELTPDHLAEADECFLTNAVNGIRWVAGYKQSRFFNKLSTFLVSELNKSIGKG